MKKVYKQKCSPCSVLWWAFVTLLFKLVQQNEKIFFRVMTQRVLDRGPRVLDLVSFKALWSCTETFIWTLNRLVPIEVHYMEKILECFHQKNENFFSTEERKTWTTWVTWGWAEERKTWTTWVTWGWVNYQQMILNYSFKGKKLPLKFPIFKKVKHCRKKLTYFSLPCFQ